MREEEGKRVRKEKRREGRKEGGKGGEIKEKEEKCVV